MVKVVWYVIPLQQGCYNLTGSTERKSAMTDNKVSRQGCGWRKSSQSSGFSSVGSGNTFVSGCIFVTIYCLVFLFFSLATSPINSYFSCLPKTRSHKFLQVYANLHKSKKFTVHLHFGNKKIKNYFPDYRNSTRCHLKQIKYSGSKCTNKDKSREFLPHRNI